MKTSLSSFRLQAFFIEESSPEVDSNGALGGEYRLIAATRNDIICLCQIVVKLLTKWRILLLPADFILSAVRYGYNNGCVNTQDTRNSLLRGESVDRQPPPTMINSGNAGRLPRTWRSVKTRADKSLKVFKWLSALCGRWVADIPPATPLYDKYYLKNGDWYV